MAHGDDRGAEAARRKVVLYVQHPKVKLQQRAQPKCSTHATSAVVFLVAPQKSTISSDLASSTRPRYAGIHDEEPPPAGRFGGRDLVKQARVEAPHPRNDQRCLAWRRPTSAAASQLCVLVVTTSDQSPVGSSGDRARTRHWPAQYPKWGYRSGGAASWLKENQLTSYTPALNVILVLNALWFGAAFRYFSLTPAKAAKILVTRSARDSPLFKTIAASVRFLGGMNAAFAAFAALLLFNRSLFPEPKQWTLFAAVFSLAHASQFAFNVPLALGGDSQAKTLWPVLRGPMLFIFVVDGTLMVANGVLAALLLFA